MPLVLTGYGDTTARKVASEILWSQIHKAEQPEQSLPSKFVKCKATQTDIDCCRVSVGDSTQTSICRAPPRDLFNPWMVESTNGMRHICDGEGRRVSVVGSAIDFSSPLYVGPPDIQLRDWDRASSRRRRDVRFRANVLFRHATLCNCRL